MRPLDGIAHIEQIDRNAHNHLKEYVSNMFHISAFMTHIASFQNKNNFADTDIQRFCDI